MKRSKEIDLVLKGAGGRPSKPHGSSHLLMHQWDRYLSQ
jgi:hypothetical protein